MIALRKTEEFERFMRGLRDERAKAKIAARIDRLTDGNPGDVKPVGEGISEMRINYGPGYRVYYCKNGDTIIVILCAGDKDSQESDIAAAKALKKGL
jgi:putative addiction module killer protein